MQQMLSRWGKQRPGEGEGKKTASSKNTLIDPKVASGERREEEGLLKRQWSSSQLVYLITYLYHVLIIWLLKWYLETSCWRCVHVGTPYLYRSASGCWHSTTASRASSWDTDWHTAVSATEKWVYKHSQRTNTVTADERDIWFRIGQRCSN